MLHRVFLKLGGEFLRKKHQMKKNRAHEFEALFIILFDLVFFINLFVPENIFFSTNQFSQHNIFTTCIMFTYYIVLDKNNPFYIYDFSVL